VTLILVSHNLEEVRNLCDNTVLLFKGEKLVEGPTPKVIGEYHQRVVGLLEAEQARQDARAAANRPQTPVEITSVQFLDKEGVPADTFFSGDPMTVRINYNARGRVERPHVVIDIDWAADDQLATTCDTRNDGVALAPIARGTGYIDCKIGPMLMVPSLYGASVRIFDGDGGAVQGESHRNRFVLNERVVVGGFYGVPHQWEQSAPSDQPLPEDEMETAV
jgi:hypothetical protein